MILQIQRGLAADGFQVAISKLCRWFGVPRRTVYYRSVKTPPKVQGRFAEPIKAMIEAEPSFGYRTVAALLRFNKNTVQRIFQLKGWQVRKRAIGHRPRIEALPSVSTAPNQRWATDLCRIWAGRDGWQTLALVIDCHTRELLGWQLSRSGKATTATAALEQALIARYGSLGRVDSPFLLRSDNGLVFTSRTYTRMVKSYGLPPGVHYAALPSAEPDGRAGHRLLDPVLQHPSASPGPRYENPCYGVCFSSLT
jgi:putative transposase